MKHSSFEGERLILIDPTDPRLSRNPTAWDRIAAALTDPELVTLAIFCAIGLVMTVGLCLLFSGFGETAASLPAF
jgi:hypothetical protein